MRNKLGKRVLTMVLAMVLTLASCVTAFAELGTDGDRFYERTEFYYAAKGTGADASKIRANVYMTTANDATTLNDNIKEVLAKDYFIDGSEVYFDAGIGSVSVENLTTMIAKKARLSVASYSENRSASVTIPVVTNADADFGGEITVGDVSSVTEKLSETGFDGKAIQFQISGRGRLPGAANFSIYDRSISYAESGKGQDGDAYLYYYDPITKSFVYVDDCSWYSYNGDSYKYLSIKSDNTKAVNKGSYVFTTKEIPKEAVKDVDVVISGESEFDTADYVGKSMEITTKDGTWYFPSITEGIKFTPTFTVGAKVEEIDKLYATVELPKTLKKIDIKFDFDGVLPGEAYVTFNVSEGDFEEGQTVYLYLYNPEKGIFTDKQKSVVKDGYVTFVFIHCSDYTVVNEELPVELTTVKEEEPPTKPTTPGTPTTPTTPSATAAPTATAAITPKTGDETSVLPFVMAFVCGCVVIGGVVVRRKTAK